MLEVVRHCAALHIHQLQGRSRFYLNLEREHGDASSKRATVEDAIVVIVGIVTIEAFG